MTKDIEKRLQCIIDRFLELDETGREFIIQNMRKEAAGREHVSVMCDALEQLT